MKIIITENQLKFLVEQKVSPIDSIVAGLWNSISGPGTDEESFYSYLNQIKTQSVLNAVNKKLLDTHKESLYDLINIGIEFTDEEKIKISQILTNNKLPHEIIKGKLRPKKPTVNLLDPATLKSSSKLVEFLKYEEGDTKQKGQPVLVGYQKRGDKPTIGYGHTGGVRVGMKINDETALKFLMRDISVAEGCVKRIFSEWKSKGNNVTITQSMFDTLVSLAFNAGCGNLRGSEKNDDLIDYIKKKDFYSASQKIKQSFLRSNFSGLITRREKESKMFCEQGGCGKSVSIT